MFDFDNLDKTLMLASQEDLARIVWQTAQHNPVVMTVAILHATFLNTREDGVLIEAVRIYGLGGMVVPFLGIKVIDVLISAIGLA